ncbi:hypothetical protein [Dyella sedimenti]|uniref:hypothetical protein n=1 Tax=Dyella sedimenti TaxID=2919947 RepID=UPI001FAB0C27|nr:hypothetical protein [Dyella sedimenti]
MKFWTVLAVGQGLPRPEGATGFELYGVVSAADPDAAFAKAIDLATQRWPELAPGSQPSALIRAEAIDEVTPVPGMEVDVVDVSWD